MTCHSPQSVFSVRYGLKVKRANATRDATEMVDVGEIARNRADQKFIREPMSQYASPPGDISVVVNPETSVAVALSRTDPYPTRSKMRRELRYRSVFVDLRPEPVFGSALDFVTLMHTDTPIQCWSRTGRFAPRRSLYCIRGL